MNHLFLSSFLNCPCLQSIFYQDVTSVVETGGSRYVQDKGNKEDVHKQPIKTSLAGLKSDKQWCRSDVNFPLVL